MDPDSIALDGDVSDQPGVDERDGLSVAASIEGAPEHFDDGIPQHAVPQLRLPAVHPAVSFRESHLGVLGMSAYTKSGVIGRPSLASPEKGRAALDHLVGAARHILKLLDETSNEG